MVSRFNLDFTYSYRMNIFSILFVILLPLSLSASVVEPRVAWDKQNVSVCWGRHQDAIKISDSQADFSFSLPQEIYELSPEKKRFLQQHIQGEFSTTRTGINFTGWNVCNGTEDVILLTVDLDTQFVPHDRLDFTPSGVASIGQDGKLERGIFSKTRKGLAPNYAAITIPHPDSLRAQDWFTIKRGLIHELGHVAGLKHEQGREEIKSYPQCQEYVGERLTRSSLLTGIYDQYSVMNYCHTSEIRRSGGGGRSPNKKTLAQQIPDPLVIKVFEQSTGTFFEYLPALSSGDVHALRCLYLYHPEQKKKLCHSGFNPWSIKSEL